MTSQNAGVGRTMPPPGPRPVISPLRVLAAVCLLAPVVAVLWVPWYNSLDPRLFGFPFFYWFQLLWVIITAVLMAVAFQAVKRDTEDRRGPAGAGGGGGGSSNGGGSGGGGEGSPDPGQDVPAGVL